ncbi:MAG: DUF192 domain-containing protein [Roseovarius sp.]
MGIGCAARRVLFLIGLALWIGAGPAAALEACRADVVHLRGDWGEARFAVEIADDPAERARGLMFRDHLPRWSGMLFIYDAPQQARFWMKNTRIPLDILFADQSGTVRRIAAMAEPGSERPIPGGDGIWYVLEINGGLARSLGITEGSVLRHPAIAPDKAAWPC